MKRFPKFNSRGEPFLPARFGHREYLIHTQDTQEVRVKLLRQGVQQWERVFSTWFKAMEFLKDFPGDEL